jgi:L-amino acid N-acyltransferase YncA
MKYPIDTMKLEDWKQVRSIYSEGINTGNSTFESEPPDWEKWDSIHLPGHRLVVREDDCILAWVAHNTIKVLSPRPIPFEP